MQKIKDALEMNKAVYEMFFSAAEGGISASDLAKSTNTAMQLNTDALAELERLTTMKVAHCKDSDCLLDALKYSTPGTLKLIPPDDLAFRSRSHETIEEQIRQKRHILIGKAIMKMNRWQRIWWAITGHHQYMTYKYWEKN